MPLTKIKSLGITDGTIAIADFSATGTPSSTTFLRGDNTWGEAGAAAGQVIQVVTATDSSGRSSTTTNTYVTGSNTLSVTITPSSTANKIFVIANHYAYNTAGSIYYTIFRGATNLGSASSINGMATLNSNNGAVDSTACYTILDSPNTTSATTYQCYMRFPSGTGYIGDSAFKSSITAFEIKG